MTNKVSLFKQIYQNYKQAHEWINKVPSEIQQSYFDNPYTNSHHKNYELLIGVIFTEQELGDIDWFLYEWSYNNSLTWKINGVEYSFKDIDEYIDMLINHRGW